MTPIVRLERCCKSYRRGPEVVQALDGVSLDLWPGETVGLVGPSGSGKTTLLNVLVGWERPDRGRVCWDGEEVTGRDRTWSELGVVPQRLGLLEELTVSENVTLPLALAAEGRSAASEWLEWLLATLGLAGLVDRLPHEVSLGEQQRAAIARALVLRPALVVLDEPTGHQDETSAQGVLTALRAVTEAGTCCLVATHGAEVAQAVDRTLVMREGRLWE